MQKKTEAERFKRRVKKSRKHRDTQSCLRVVVMFPSLRSIMCNCNQISAGEKKVTILLPKYRELTLVE